MSTLHLGTLSSGASSAYACKLMLDEVCFSGDDVQLVFTDTLAEHPDNYRFLDDVVSFLGADFVQLADGRTPLELAWDKHAIPSDFMPFCSEILKRVPLERYVVELKDDGYDDIVIWWGIGFEEIHRALKIFPRWLEKFDVFSRFPLIEQTLPFNAPHEWLEQVGISLPVMYSQGFAHANCGSQGCVRGGLSHWALLYRTNPCAFIRSADLEKQWIEDFGKKHTILTMSRFGRRTPVTLYEFKDILDGGALFPDSGFSGGGACGCSGTFGGAK